MAVYIVTGKLGNGKTLCSVGRIRDKLRAGCMVATNLDLDLVSMFGEFARHLRVLRVPDKPTRSDLDAIGCGNPTYDESLNGVLVLDECGTWFNSRNWQDKTRGDVNAWFLHARKLGWDVLLIVQDIALLDSQARDALAEHVVYCRRLDNIAVPLLGTLYKAITGYRLRMPRVHVARVSYGAEHNAPLSDRWVYRGNDLFRCYDTRQAFLRDYPHGVFSMLTPWHTVGRYRVPRDWGYYMRITRIIWKRVKSPVAFASGVLLGVAGFAGLAFADLYREQSQQLVSDQAPQSSPAASPGSASDGVQSDSLAHLATLRITGSAQFGRRWIYDLSDPALETDEEPALHVSTLDLEASGYGVTPRGRCRVEVSKGAAVITIPCV